MLRCSGPADFLAALPFIAGFEAEDSLFVVLFVGSRSRNALRIDLPAEESAVEALELADVLGKILTDTGGGPEGAAVVITSSRGFEEAGGVPWRGLAKIIRRRFRREGWPLKELAVVAPDGWQSMLAPQSQAGRRPLSEIAASSVGERARAIVGETPPSLDQLAELPAPDAERAGAILARLAELDGREREREQSRAQSQRSKTSEPVGLPAWLHGVARVADACIGREEGRPEPRLCARLIRACEHPASWLVTVLTLATRPEFVIDIAESMDSECFTDTIVDAETGWSVRRLLFLLGGARPDPPTRLRQAADMLSHVAAHAPRARRPGLLAMLAWAWWMLGMQSVAARHVASSLEIDPEHELTRMVERLTSTPPEWGAQAILDFREHP